GRKIESGEIVSNTDPQVPGELYKRSMRDVDNGKTLARVADLSGWEWPARAAQALIDSIKSGDQDESTPAGRTALEHAFEIIEEDPNIVILATDGDRWIKTTVLIQKLKNLESAEGTWRRLTDKKLSMMWRGYGLKSGQFWPPGSRTETKKG